MTVLTEQELAEALLSLRRGRLVAAATESFFALMADATNPQALERLFQLKGRDSGKGVGLMVPDANAWQALVQRPPGLALDLARAFWPGPLSLVCAAAEGLDPRVQSDGTVSIRVPGPSPAAVVVRAFGGPVTATSANLAGEPPRITRADVAAALERSGAELPLIVGGDAPGGAVSTLVRVDGTRLSLLRAGAISRERLLQVAPELS